MSAFLQTYAGILVTVGVVLIAGVLVTQGLLDGKYADMATNLVIGGGVGFAAGVKVQAKP